jgi:hypothetical protein
MGGYAGSTIEASVTYSATSRVASVTDMRTVGRCGERALQDAVWEPFVEQKSFPVYVVLNWSGFSVSVQYRDARGNLSPVYCADINVEGMPPPPSRSTATPTIPVAKVTTGSQPAYSAVTFSSAFDQRALVPINPGKTFPYGASSIYAYAIPPIPCCDSASEIDRTENIGRPGEDCGFLYQ